MSSGERKDHNVLHVDYDLDETPEAIITQCGLNLKPGHWDALPDKQCKRCLAKRPTSEAPLPLKPCPKCQAPLEYMSESNDFVGCTARDCLFTKVIRYLKRPSKPPRKPAAKRGRKR